MQHLNESQRYTIYRMRKDKKTQSEITRYIGVSQATVSKELNRNADTRGRYSPKMAQMFADMMKKRSRRQATPPTSTEIILKYDASYKFHYLTETTYPQKP